MKVIFIKTGIKMNDEYSYNYNPINNQRFPYNTREIHYKKKSNKLICLFVILILVFLPIYAFCGVIYYKSLSLERKFNYIMDNNCTHVHNYNINYSNDNDKYYKKRNETDKIIDYKEIVINKKKMQESIDDI